MHLTSIIIWHINQHATPLEFWVVYRSFQVSGGLQNNWIDITTQVETTTTHVEHYIIT